MSGRCSPVFLACGVTDMRKGFDGQGLCLFSKRMDRGRFVWPVTATGTVALTSAQVSMLLEGIDWRRPERTWSPTLAG
ncbi:IS66 family insertion sequence element accessory protein TnpB [Sphingomonas aurantiaca]|jgi:transposase|nr:IS66 family insertion sequence element accessory protein TnpB [Sphingomonas aurantiaca]